MFGPCFDSTRLIAAVRRLARVHALAHVLDDGMRADDLDALFADASRSGGAHGVVDVQPAADQRRVADPAGNLEREAAGRGDARQVAGLRRGPGN